MIIEPIAVYRPSTFPHTKSIISFSSNFIKFIFNFDAFWIHDLAFLDHFNLHIPQVAHDVRDLWLSQVEQYEAVWLCQLTDIHQLAILLEDIGDAEHR